MSISSFISNSEAETKKIAFDFAGQLQGNEKVCLVGPLGSGKTTFVRGFVQAYGISPMEVQSPTFTLVREYKGSKTLYHIDLYRLENEEHIFEAGIFELISDEQLVLIEWADRLNKYYPQDAIRITFSHGEDGNRILEVETV